MRAYTEKKHTYSLAAVVNTTHNPLLCNWGDDPSLQDDLIAAD